MIDKSVLLAKNRLFLSGPFGAGKTTAAIERIRWLLGQERIRGDRIVVLVPQRTLGRPYYEALRSPRIPGGSPVRITTFAGLARAAVELYWPLLAGPAGFEDPGREPTFLNLETAQYHMSQFVEEAFEQGAFDAIRVEPGRVVSQVLDNLNKAALHGFSVEEAYRRLELSVPQGPQMATRLNVLQAARQISQDFRALCLRLSLVDFSLWIRLFEQQVLTNEWSRTHLFRSHDHLIMDNAEEDTYAAQDLVRQWLSHLQSCLIVEDEDAGIRVFLGANPAGVADLADACDRHLRAEQSHIMAPALSRMVQQVNRSILSPGQVAQLAGGIAAPDTSRSVEAVQELTEQEDNGYEETALPLTYRSHRFYPQMIDWVVDEIEELVHDHGVAAGQIAVLAPFVSDALRFSLQTRLDEREIPSTTHRPSRALKAEPAARVLLTLAALAHPTWQLYPARSDVGLSLQIAITDLDPVRATLLSRVAYRLRGEQAGDLAPFGPLKDAVKTRITFRSGELYEKLRVWLQNYRAETQFTPLDQFFARIFGEVLSQPGFGFHLDLDAARVTSQLVDSARNFRWSLEEQGGDREISQANIGRFYLELVEEGALGALYAPGWEEDKNAVFIAPAYTFLMRNRPMHVQFWLDIGASGWWERLYQPLTHPYVLSRRWPPNQVWSDLHEYQQRQDTLRRLLLGLLRRTQERIYLGLSDYSENGMEQRGPLLSLVNQILVQEADPALHRQR